MKYLPALIIFALDRALKTTLIDEPFVIVNNGMVFGYLAGFKYATELLFIFLVGLLLYILRNRRRFSDFETMIYFVLLAAGLSNWLDRILYNGVVDYLKLAYLPQFNLADAAIVAGAILLLLYEIGKFNGKIPSN